MIDGCIDRLTVIRRLDIVFRGIPDVRRMIKRGCGYHGIQYSKDNWTKFWKYFKATWIKKFVSAWWNTNGLGKDIVNRTNNPLERYNRTLNDAFSVAHPDVTQFISVIEAQSRAYVRLINDISNRRTTAPAHAPAQPAPTFDSDSDFEVDSDSDLDVSDPGSEASDGASVASRSPEF
ncbi:hypothetical protein F442_15842 [Phytophthora nicotianae P10297]|uniref:Uncharacterized protein n=3 Tax=Phytophthora nicotianae TaxID=4792 RepID=W2YMR7_PHYNI|nr:hypothetical protein F444_15978 [Phytophthora nicotianae P1976]ETP36122.1 hypothetical protein F442_15842 [Phytophthora nicotianae P10297]